MVVGLWIASQVFAYNLKFVFAPFHYLATWAHELGHGLGAVLGGGKFNNMLITQHYGGLAFSEYPSDFSYWLSVVTGLIGPSLAGFFVIAFGRRFKKARIVLWVLTVLLVLTALFFSKDMFTRGVTLGLAVPIGAVAYWGSVPVRSLFTQIIGITLCLNAIAGFDYFFFKSGSLPEGLSLADTQILAKYFWGNQLFWALFISALSLLILYFAGRVAMIEQAKEDESGGAP